MDAKELKSLIDYQEKLHKNYLKECAEDLKHPDFVFNEKYFTAVFMSSLLASGESPAIALKLSIESVKLLQEHFLNKEE